MKKLSDVYGQKKFAIKVTKKYLVSMFGTFKIITQLAKVKICKIGFTTKN